MVRYMVRYLSGYMGVAVIGHAGVGAYIDFHINNFTALSVGDILPVLSPSLWPCEINYLKIYSIRPVLLCIFRIDMCLRRRA
jgi:hypothetical protein